MIVEQFVWQWEIINRKQSKVDRQCNGSTNNHRYRNINLEHCEERRIERARASSCMICLQSKSNWIHSYPLLSWINFSTVSRRAGFSIAAAARSLSFNCLVTARREEKKKQKNKENKKEKSTRKIKKKKKKKNIKRKG